MLVVSYDISDNKTRTIFSKFLCKFGYRLQYSVYCLKNSEKVLSNVVSEIEGKFSKCFGQQDSVLIFNFSKSCKISKFGYAKNDDDELIILG